MKDDRPPIDPAVNSNPCRGVYWRKKNWQGVGVWRMRITSRAHAFDVEFDDPYEAAMLYDVAAHIAHGPDAFRNLPGAGLPKPPPGWTRAGISEHLYIKGLI